LTDPKSLDSRNNLSERAPAPRYSPGGWVERGHAYITQQRPPRSVSQSLR